MISLKIKLLIRRTLETNILANAEKTITLCLSHINTDIDIPTHIEKHLEL